MFPSIYVDIFLAGSLLHIKEINMAIYQGSDRWVSEKDRIYKTLFKRFLNSYGLSFKLTYSEENTENYLTELSA